MLSDEDQVADGRDLVLLHTKWSGIVTSKKKIEMGFFSHGR